MTEWHEVRDTREETPPVIDTETSAVTVYERRNIRRETVTDERPGGGGSRELWVYEQREYTAEEYQGMTSPATRGIMQAISALELSIAEL